MGEVIISQYIEGSKLNKAVVVTNRGTTSADLSEYELKLSVNSKPWSEAVKPLASGVVLKPGESFSVCNPGFAEDSKELAKQLCDKFDSAISFNGNDAVGLFRNGKLVDTFGQENGEGLDSEGGYTIAGVPAASKDHTIVRDGSVTQGETNWEASAKSQWNVLPKDTFVKNIGSPVSIPSSTETPTGLGPTDKKDDPASPVTPDRVVSSQPLEEPKFPDAQGLRMATFNVLFLFDGINDPSISPYRGKPEEAEKHFVRVKDLVKTLKVDLLNLCEVEDGVILDRMAEAIGGGMLGHFVQGTDSFTGQDVGLLSRATPSEMYRSEERVTAPLPGSQCGSDRSKNTGVSKHYVAKFDAEQYFPFKFAMVGVHLKARPTDPASCSQREGQAEVIRRIIVDLIKDGYEVAVLGDVNDYSDKTQDKIDNMPTSRVLAMLRDPFNKGEDDLRNVADVIPKEDRYTSWWDRNRDGDVDRPQELTQIDHILLTKGLWDLMDRAWVDHRMDPTVVSDHWPLVVDFKALQK